MYKSGFVSVVGRPNVGKSSLLNKIIGEKISIISDKPQTTRNKIQLVYTEENMQVVFLDTPGMQRPKNELGEYMLRLSKSSLEEMDLIFFMVDGSETIGPLDQMILDFLEEVETPVLLLINKVDVLEEETVRMLREKYLAMNRFVRVLPISAKEGTGVEELLEEVRELLPEGPQYFPEDMITDQPERFIISELIREKALIYMREEIPHGIFVGIDKISKREDKNLIDVYATLFVEKESHKGMVIGKKGSMLNKIGSAARKDIERLLDTHVNLKLWVKVEKDWRKKKNKVKEFGYL